MEKLPKTFVYHGHRAGVSRSHGAVLLELSLQDENGNASAPVPFLIPPAEAKKLAESLTTALAALARSN